MIHLMELPNPDPTTGRPEQGAEDRHVCVFVKDLKPLKALFDKTGKLIKIRRG
jgi:glyoxylase I family protein